MIVHPTALDTPSRPPSGMSSVRVLTGMNPWGLWGVLAVVMTVLGYLYADSLRFLMQNVAGG